MSCRELNEQISLYLDGLLTPAQTRKLKEHSAVCSNCQKKISLMQQIPIALRTDRMIAPRPEFTTVVMQQLLVKQHFTKTEKSSFLEEAALHGKTSLATYHTEKSARTPFKIIPLPASSGKAPVTRSPKPRYSPQTPVAYLLRFASLAACLVVVVGVGVYFSNALGVVETTSAQATVSNAISSFAALVLDSFNSPLALLIGVALFLAIVITTWWFLKRTKRPNRF